VSTTLITADGRMYETMFIEITKEQFDDIASNGEDSDSFAELNDAIYGDSRINGYSFERAWAGFTVFIDGEDRGDLISEFLEEAQKSTPYIEKLRSSEDSYYLIFEKSCVDGYQQIEIEGEFDPDCLEFGIDAIEMPDGTHRAVMYVTYDGEYLEFESSWTENEELYLVGPDKERVDLP